MPETNHYDVQCPICGTVNRHLFLEETDGWMICEKCEAQVRVPEFAKWKKIPLFTMKSLSEALNNAHA